MTSAIKPAVAALRLTPDFTPEPRPSFHRSDPLLARQPERSGGRDVVAQSVERDQAASAVTVLASSGELAAGVRSPSLVVFWAGFVSASEERA
jgi:hypothetical protein